MTVDPPASHDDLEAALRGPTALLDKGQVDAAIGAFGARAASDGLGDVAYATTETPFGTLLLARTDEGLVRLSFPGEGIDGVIEDLARRISPRILRLPARLDEVRRELDAYFEGNLRDFSIPVDWRLTKGFRSEVLRHTARIPYGDTVSYTEIADAAGNPKAQRAAGSALGSNPIPIVVPCHRVLRTGGALGGYGGGLPMKQALLELEGAL